MRPGTWFGWHSSTYESIHDDSVYTDKEEKIQPCQDGDALLEVDRALESWLIYWTRRRKLGGLATPWLLAVLLAVLLVICLTAHDTVASHLNLQRGSSYGRVYSDHRVQWQAKYEKAQDWHTLVNAPTDCVTYLERNRPYITRDVRPSSPPPHRGATQAFMMRMSHSAFNEPMQQDRLMSYRALVAEAETVAGVDVFFVPHIPPDVNTTEFLNSVSSEFRSRVIPFSFETAIAPYPNIDWRNVMWSNHIAVNYFLDLEQSQQYDQVWWAEEDTRLLGTWQDFFAKVNSSLAVSRWQSWVPREDTLKPPNLMLFMGEDNDLLCGGWVSPRAEDCLGFVDASVMSKAWITLGFSTRQLHEAFKTLYQAGHSCYTEYFIPTAARYANLSTISLSMPIYKHAGSAGTTFDWAGVTAHEFYREWRENLDMCAPTPMLLHKWKE
ncbi:hypothetical protein E5Q_01056 [Mixia osmundae IAM 14324]|uniref:Uncharacterized protein n=1 Tax=Mixia osmundae (strain CBS 9802 / IAM 14324 / JCM 22182 / KY 12970) TaxID=764103 RepID=G7DUZ4_MIXOS|nr:hypothetical protein E5Q_01056 [Mixia osmundae IAM 14324]